MDDSSRDDHHSKARVSNAPGAQTYSQPPTKRS